MATFDEKCNRRYYALSSALDLAFELDDMDKLEQILSDATVLYDVELMCMLIRRRPFLARVAAGHEQRLRDANGLGEACEILNIELDRETDEGDESAYKEPLSPRREDQSV
jgi:hypothetical protein